MGHINLTSPKQRNNPTRKWQLLDFVSMVFFAVVILFFLLIFTSLGDSLAASGSQALIRSATADPKQRQQLVALIETGKHPEIESCAADTVDYMPCEDPTRNSQLSREMNFYRERHCPSPDETPLCLIPPPQGYHVPIQWPESLHKVNLVLQMFTCCLFGSNCLCCRIMLETSCILDLNLRISNLTR